ncbi:MAG: AAA family ATPase [Planctomycetota bacterium]
MRDIVHAFPSPAVERFLAGLVEDVVTHRLHAPGGVAASEDENGQSWQRRYAVNVVRTQDPASPCPIVIETQPTLLNLVGTIDRRVSASGAVLSDHLMVRGGSILASDGGYLVLEARDVLTEPGAWRTLVHAPDRSSRSDRTSRCCSAVSGLEAGADPGDLKVVLIGDPGIYSTLDQLDPDFPQLFKVPADFDSSMPPRRRRGALVRGHASRRWPRTRICRTSPPTASRPSRSTARVSPVAATALTTRFGRLGDIARESAYLARQEGHVS